MAQAVIGRVMNVVKSRMWACDFVSMPRAGFLALLCLAVCSLALCSGCAHQRVMEPVFECECGGLTPVHMVGSMYLAGQPTAEDLRVLHSQGIQRVINLRLPEELTSFDEAAEVRALGMRYFEVAFKGPAMLTDEVFDEVREILRDGAGEGTLLHCGTANRVGAVWVAYRVLDEGQPLEEAMGEAKGVGLRSPGYEQRAREYIAARMAK